MRKRIKSILLAAMVLAAAGVGIQQALERISDVEGISCAEWVQLLQNLKDTEEGMLIAEALGSSCRGIRVRSNCSLMPDGKICRYGLLVGQGLTSSLRPKDDKSGENTCVVSSGTLVPCIANGKDWLERYTQRSTPAEDTLQKAVKRISSLRSGP